MSVDRATRKVHVQSSEERAARLEHISRKLNIIFKIGLVFFLIYVIVMN